MQTKKFTDVKNVHEDCQKDGNLIKPFNNDVTANNNDEVDRKIDYKPYTLLANCSTLTNAYQQPVESSTTDAQKRYLANAPKTVIPNRANSGIVLITAKLNQSDESKLIQYNVSGGSTNTLSKTNLEKFNSVKRATTTEDLTPLTAQKQATIGSNEQQQQQQQPKTATILVSKSKTKTGLPLLLKKSK